MGRGAVSAAISTLKVPSRRPGAFSQTQPPCICAEIMLTGAATCTRSSTAVSRNVWVPPPEAPVQAIRAGSTSGSSVRKSSDRIEFHSCRPSEWMPHNHSRQPPKVR